MGFDYADQRFYASSYGRFNTPDPARSSAGPSDPSSWNRYSYTRGDPVNKLDPSGTGDCFPDDGTCFESLSSGYCPPDLPFCSDGSSYLSMAGCGGTQPDLFNPSAAVWCLSTTSAAQNIAAAAAAALAPPGPNMLQICEGNEIAYVAGYLSQYNSPLAASASTIVVDSTVYGLDDRFIVALSGVETTYGTNPSWNSGSAGIYNVFSNGLHCAAPGLSMCRNFSKPYASYAGAIVDVTSTIGSSQLYSGLNSAQAVYSEYEEGNVSKPAPMQSVLNTIYGTQLNGNLNNIRSPRCQ